MLLYHIITTLLLLFGMGKEIHNYITSFSYRHSEEENCKVAGNFSSSSTILFRIESDSDFIKCSSLLLFDQSLIAAKPPGTL